MYNRYTDSIAGCLLYCTFSYITECSLVRLEPIKRWVECLKLQRKCYHTGNNLPGRPTLNMWPVYDACLCVVVYQLMLQVVGHATPNKIAIAASSRRFRKVVSAEFGVSVIGSRAWRVSLGCSMEVGVPLRHVTRCWLLGQYSERAGDHFFGLSTRGLGDRLMEKVVRSGVLFQVPLHLVLLSPAGGVSCLFPHYQENVAFVIRNIAPSSALECLPKLS